MHIKVLHDGLVCVAGNMMDPQSQTQLVETLRSTFKSGVTLPEQFRRSQLTRLMSMIRDNEDQINKALHQDIAKVHVILIPVFVSPVFHRRHTHAHEWLKVTLQELQTFATNSSSFCSPCSHDDVAFEAFLHQKQSCLSL